MGPVPDVHLAALAMEYGPILCSMDGASRAVSGTSLGERAEGLRVLSSWPPRLRSRRGPGGPPPASAGAHGPGVGIHFQPLVLRNELPHELGIPLSRFSMGTRLRAGASSCSGIRTTLFGAAITDSCRWQTPRPKSGCLGKLEPHILLLAASEF